MTLSTNAKNEGTIGGMVTVDGQDIIVTCHHVAFSIDDDIDNNGDGNPCPSATTYSPEIITYENRQEELNKRIQSSESGFWPSNQKLISCARPRARPLPFDSTTT